MLRYYSDLLPLLNSPLLSADYSRSRMGDLLFHATPEQHLRFMDAMLKKIIEDHSGEIPEEIVLASLLAVISDAQSEIALSLISKDVPIELQSSVFDKILVIFTRLFASRCDDTLTPAPDSPNREWNSICSVWWSMMYHPYSDIPDPDFRQIDMKILDVLGKILELDHLACKESAIRGLGHWFYFLPEEAPAMLERHWADIPEALRDYAESAKVGEIS